MTSCCETTEKKSESNIDCPACGRRGKGIDAVTPRSLLKAGPAANLDVHVSWYFCATPDCETVYFSTRGDRYEKDALRVRVGLKETEDPIPVCYCFDYTVGQIREDFERSASTSIPDRIRDEIKAGNCSCETENPEGTCCLGNVMRAVKDQRRKLCAAG